MNANTILAMSRYFANYLLAIGLVGSMSALAQEAVLNTPMWVNKGLFNPSYVGGEQDQRFGVMLTSKKLWSGIHGSPQMLGLAFDKNLGKQHALGIQAMSHQYATMGYTSVAVPYVFKVPFTRESGLTFGLAPKITNAALDLSKITDPASLDVVPTVPNVTFLDAVFGAHYHAGEFFQAGFFAGNFLINGSIDPNDIVNYTNYSTTVFGGDVSVRLPQTRNRPVGVYFDANVKSNDYTPAIAEVHTRFVQKGNGVGLGYRSNGEINFSLELGDMRSFRIHYVYSHVPAFLNQFTFGTHQIAFQMLSFKN